MRRIVVSFMLAVAVAGPGATGIRTAEAAGSTVTFTDRAEPAALTVSPGSRVTFANQSGERKRVRSADGPAEFDSGNIEPGEVWSVVLDSAGTYAYVDDRDRENAAYHGTITVSTATQPVGGSPAASPSQPPSGSPTAPAPATASVAVLDRSFSPTAVTVAPGGTVTWNNQSDRDHTVTGAGFDSGVFAGGGRFSHTFASAGTFTYICELHSEMRGSVTVTGNGAATQPGATPAAPAPPAPVAPAPPPAPQATTPAPAGSAGGAAPVRHDVVLVDYAFRPGALSARVGDSVVWANQGRAPHTATVPGVLDTGMFRTGEQRTTVLPTAGTFTFTCTFHPEMTGVLTVAPAANGPAVPATSPGSAPTSKSPAAPFGSATTTSAPAGLSLAEEPKAEAAEVSVVDFAFEPATVRLRVGGTVTWRNNGTAPHTVSAVDSSFESGLLESAGTFSHRFDQVGTYRYICAFHPGMEGTVEIAHDRSSDAAAAGVADAVGDGGEQAAASSGRDAGGDSPGAGALLAALIGGAALLAGSGAFLYGGSRMVAAGDRP